MPRVLYSLLLYCLIPATLVRLIYRSLRSPAYRLRWAERFGFAADLSNQNIIWLHAVSVGVTLAAVPLVKALQAKYPDYRLLVTCMTVTGSQRIEAAFGDTVEHCYAPYDMPDAVARFLKRVNPNADYYGNELWPNTIAACRRRNIPVVLANGRLSDKSARGYRKIAPLVKPMLHSLNGLIAQHTEDGQRFIDLGLPPQALTVSGNIKFDLCLDSGLQQKAIKLAREWRGSQDRPVWLVASTHQGEDEIILQAFQQVVSGLEKPPLLVLVPRHPERFDSVYELCSRAGFSVAKRSDKDADVSRAAILLGDTMGELMLFYGACDIAFVGGSLVPNGGHNMIEPAAWGVPIISGPHLFNFSEVSQLLIGGDAMLICESATQLAEQCVGLLQNPQRRQSMGDAAKHIADENRGALAKLLEQIDNQLQQ